MTSLATPARIQTTTYAVLLAVTGGHFINDTMQAVLLAIYPVLRDAHALTFTQIGSSRWCSRRRRRSCSRWWGFMRTSGPCPTRCRGAGAHLLRGHLLGFAPNYAVILAAAALIGIGSSVFHPEASRLARLSSGGRYGFAQSLFQLGGNFGTALGPVLAASSSSAMGSTVWRGCRPSR